MNNISMPKKGRPPKKDRFFQLGHPCYKKRVASEETFSEPVSIRLPESTFKDAVRVSADNKHYTVTDSEGNPGNMRFFRPIKEVDNDHTQNLQEDEKDISGYKILHCGKLLEMFNDFYLEHLQTHPKCELSFGFNSDTCQKWGFSWRMGLKCNRCNFVGKKHKVYIESSQQTVRGQCYSTVNLGFHVGLQACPLGIEGLRTLFLSGGIPVPSCSAMHNAGIYVSDNTESVNEADMQERRKYLTDLNKLRGFEESHPVSVSGDARYNNRLDSGAGKTPAQPATQSVYTITSNETPGKEILAVNIDNMLCPTGQLLKAKCPDHPGTCTANLSRADIIGNEGRSAQRIALKIAQDPVPLVVGQFTSDGDSAASLGYERGQKIHSNIAVENLRDTRHMSESHRKVIKNIEFSKTMFPGKNKVEREKLQHRFAMEATQRCTAEVTHAHQHFGGNLNKIIRKLSFTTDSIVMCVTGDCGKVCTKHSFVCSGRKRGAWKGKFLPDGTVLNPSEADLKKLRECVELRLGPSGLRKTRLNTNTQKNESVNRTFTKTNPKSSNWTRTLSGRIHSAVLMRNMGTSKSIRRLTATVGASIDNSSLVLRQLQKIQDRNDYQKERKESSSYKERQAYLRRERFNVQQTVTDNTNTYRKNILDPEMALIQHDHGSMCSKKPKTFRMKIRKN